MTIVTKSAPIAALMTLAMLVPVAAQAQAPRFRVSFAPAATTVSGDAELAWAGSLGYRFSEHLWFEGEFTWIDAAAGGFRDNVLDFDGRQTTVAGMRDLMTRRSLRFGSGGFAGGGFPNVPQLAESGPFRASIDGSTMIGALGLRYELPVQTDRFRPYVSGALGLNRTEQEFDLERLAGDLRIFDDRVSHTGYAFNAGAGASVRLFKQLWADVDAKYFRLSRERNVMRMGGGVSWRF